MTNEPRIKDFHMDPNHRKFLFAEEYCTGVSGIMPEMSVQDYAVLMQQAAELHQHQKHEQEIRRSRSQSPPEIFPNKIGTVFQTKNTIVKVWPTIDCFIVLKKK